MRNDKITNGGELTTTQPFNNNGQSFYLLLIPKNQSAPSVAILKVKMADERNVKEFPFLVNMWNPIIVNSVEATSSDLANYTIYYGGE